MRTVRGAILGIWLGMVPPLLLAQNPISWETLDTILNNLSFAADADLRMVVLHRGEPVYTHRIDFRGEPELLPIASASKWLAGATILRLVDEGLIGLDDPVGMYLPYFQNEKAVITIRQLLTHSSGMSGDYPCLFQREMQLGDCVRQIAERPLLLEPGANFSYGDVSLQVAARVAEVVTGLNWNEVFRSRIAEPLGMELTTYDADGNITNPNVAGGASSTIEEYLLFLRMIRSGGVLGDVRVLSRRAVDLMLADQTAGAVIRSTPFSAFDAWKAGASRNRYGFANWLEGMEDGLPDANSSQGGFGVSPYYDRERDLIFLLFLYDQRRVYPPYYYQIQSFLNGVYPVPGAAAVGDFDLRSLTTNIGLRSWFEYVPNACKAEAAQCPLLIALHPNGTNGSAFGTASGLREKAEREGFVLALPNGLAPGQFFPIPLPTPQHLLEWDIGIPGSSSLARDDAAFVFSMTSVLEHTHQVDAQRIYMAGHREGADLAQRLMCRSPERFAALASVHAMLPYPSGGLPGDGMPVCQPREAAPVFLYAGTETAEDTDEDPEEGPEVPSSFEFWKQRNRCSAVHTWQPFSPSALSYTDATGCWPGTTVREVRSTDNSTAWPADGWELAWNFLRSHHRPALREGRFIATSAASYARRAAAAGSLVSLFGMNLASATETAGAAPLPMELGGVRVEVRDSRGLTRVSGLAMVSAMQVNLVLPEDLAEGPAVVTVHRDGEQTHHDWIEIRNLAPALFSAAASGEGPPAGEVLYVHADGSRESHFLAQIGGRTGQPVIQPRPVEIWRDGTEVYVILYGTGWRRANGEPPVEVFAGSQPLEVLYAGSQFQYDGLDQINVRIDGTGIPSGEYPVFVRIGDRESNRLRMVVYSVPGK